MAQTPTGWNQGRFNNIPGMNRDNAPYKPVDPNLIQRIGEGIREFFGMHPGVNGRELPFFPPGQPLPQVAPSAIGRRFDYPTNYNAITKPRSYEPIDFETLRAISDPSVGGWDLIRLAIETRKDQMAKLTFSILPRKPANAQVRPKSDKRCQEVEEFLRRPDGVHSWADWVRMLCEEQLVIDAPVIYKRPSLEGKLARLELMDGSLIKPVLGYDGRRPDSGPAWTQALKGLTAVHYSADELIVAPRNPRVNRVYGYSCVEQIITTVNIALRRQAAQLTYFTEGAIPDAVAQVPPDWSMQRIQEYQDYWDTMVNDAVTRRKLKFIPGGVAFQQTRTAEALVDQFDEWLARIVQYCFSLPPTPLVRMMNRGTAESAYEQSLDEGLQPLMMWMRDVINDIVVRWFGYADLEMVWDDVKKTDPAEKEQRDAALADRGVISLDDIRAERGLEPLGIEPFVKGLGQLGFMSVSAIKKAIAAGYDLTGIPQPQIDPMTGQPIPGSTPGMGMPGDGNGQDPFAGLPPEILQALGLDPSGSMPPGSSDFSDASASGGDFGDAGPLSEGNRHVEAPDSSGAAAPGDPIATPPQAHASPNGGAPSGARGQVIPMHKHPAVHRALKDGEAHAHRLAAKMRGRQ